MLATLILLIAALIFSLQFKSVQTYVAKKAANYLSTELKTRIEIGSLYIKPFKSVVLENLYVEDREKDTLLYSPKFSVDLNLLSTALRKVSVNTVEMDNGKFYLKQYKDSATNLEFIIKYFSPGTKTRKKPSKPYDITFDKIVLNNIAFKYKNFNSDKIIKGINFNDIDLRNLNTTIENLDTKKHLVKANFQHLSFREKSGFYLKNLTAAATIDTNQMEFKQFSLETPHTRLSDYLLFKYNKFKDFGQFVNKVYMKAHFKNTHIDSRDIAFFAPKGLSKTNAEISLDGNASGYVNNLKARNLSLKAGKTTYLKGDFNIKGLPDINNTQLDLKFNQVYTNKKDLDYLITKFTGKETSIIPPIIDKFGNVNFRGNFTGSTNNFIAKGEFKTRLGRIISNINFKMGKNNTPIYSGLVKAVDFNLGDLLNQKNLGRTTFKANINGSSFNLKSLHEQIKSDITYFDFNGYRYNNIALNGNFNDKFFDGRVKINDRNIKLDFDGGVDLNPKLPVFNFNAIVRGANLRTLKLTKDTVQIDADLNTNFSGNNLDNIQGTVNIKKIRLTNPHNSLVVDFVSLAANGIGVNRSLNIKSDILDASIQGEYDLNTLPSYFKSVVKKYIPSLQVNIVTPKKQNFEFQLNVKNFEPISLLFMPELKIPDGVGLNGKFISSENVANLSGFAKLIQYKKIKINNLILDEGTTKEAMNLFITSDRVDLSDSLFVKNINIANILRNDSLNLNIKLSDKDAINQLDLNSLVEFNTKRDSAVKLSLLPSDVIINREVWKIQEKVSFNFDEGRDPNQSFSLLRRTRIKGFQLFRDNQILTVDGVISADPKDELLIGFNKFKLTTFNPLAKALGITLRGELNGNAKLSSLGKTPRIEAAIKIDSLHYNNIAIGDLNLAAHLDNSTKLIDVKMDIMNLGQKTLDIAGTYNSNIDHDNLNMTVQMEDNEIILFQPFLKKLVSNLNGKVSADLKVTGELKNPQIKGTLDLKNAGLTVNYLKTRYFISDHVTVENSVIKLDNLVLKDVNNHEAQANGTVDMRNPNTPTINITLVANNFMALNTTAKDNSVYYGTAYGTGVFTFNGPTNNMRIKIDAKTDAGTVFNIPLNSSVTVRDNDFITFVAKDSSLNVKKEASFNGLTMDFDLQVDENSEVNIYTDLGRLSGRGNGNLNLKITSLGDFEMFGDYLISKGRFEFTAKEVINKNFEISQGGSIRWTGNPTEAAINLKAIYSVRTSLSPLYIAAGRPAVDQRVIAEAVMNLTGLLLHPAISFDINFPADSYLKDEFQSYFSDVNNVNQQALSLIVRRSFAPGTGTDISAANSNVIGAINSTFINAGTELFFNQLNSILTQTLNLNFVDLNIRSFNDASASFRLLNDRLVITGGVTDRRGDLNDFNVIGSSVARDLELQYLIKKDGSLVARLSNRLNNRNFLNTNEVDYVSAIGLVYRQDFDNLNEFLSILIGKKRREERQKKALEENKKASALKPEENREPKK